MTKRETIFIVLEADQSGLGWEIYKGSVVTAMSISSSPEPIRKIGTLTFSKECFHLNSGEELSQEEMERVLSSIRRNAQFKEISTSYARPLAESSAE